MNNAAKRMSSAAKVIWVVVGVAALVVIGYVASRVGNLAARGVRGGEGQIELSVSEPVVPGVAVKVSWNTALGQESVSVVLRGRGRAGEVVIGSGEFGAGQANITIPCDMGSQEISVSLYTAPSGEAEELLASTSVDVLPAGPDCLR